MSYQKRFGSIAQSIDDRVRDFTFTVQRKNQISLLRFSSLKSSGSWFERFENSVEKE